MDVDEDLVLAQPQLLGHGVDDPLVGLVRDDQGNVRHRLADVPQDLDRSLTHPSDRLDEDLAAVHDEPVVIAAQQ